MKVKKRFFNLRIPPELFDALTEYVNQYKKIGSNRTKVFVVEQLLFKELRKKGFLNTDYIRKVEDYYV